MQQMRTKRGHGFTYFVEDLVRNTQRFKLLFIANRRDEEENMHILQQVEDWVRVQSHPFLPYLWGTIVSSQKSRGVKGLGIPVRPMFWKLKGRLILSLENEPQKVKPWDHHRTLLGQRKRCRCKCCINNRSIKKTCVSDLWSRKHIRDSDRIQSDPTFLYPKKHIDKGNDWIL